MIYWTFAYLIMKDKVFDLKFLNKVMEEAPSSTWNGHRAPRPFSVLFLKLCKNGKLRKGGKARFTASEATNFSLARYSSES